MENSFLTAITGHSTHEDLVKNPACGAFCLMSLACGAFNFIKNLACGTFLSHFYLNRDAFDMKILVLSTNLLVVK